MTTKTAPTALEATSTRVVTLVRRPGPEGPVRDDFRVETRPLPEPGPGQVLVRNAYMSVDPSMRGRLEDTEKQYTTNFEIGGALDGSAIGRVIASRQDTIPAGAAVRHRMGWRDLAVLDGSDVHLVDESIAPLPTWLGVLGQTGFSAYVGLLRAAEMRGGDIVFVSGAAGAVGSAAGQMARLLGAARVVGSAGGSDKCRFLVEECGFDGAFDYRSEAPRDALRRLAPEGIDVYFDNVGGTQLVAALHEMRIGGRIALCGQISQFGPGAGGNDIGHLIQATLRRVSLRGFIVRDHEDLRPEFEQRVAAWLRSGQLVSRETIVEGLEHAVDAFLGMLRGANTGKMLVRLDSEVDG